MEGVRANSTLESRVVQEDIKWKAFARTANGKGFLSFVMAFVKGVLSPCLSLVLREPYPFD